MAEMAVFCGFRLSLFCNFTLTRCNVALLGQAATAIGPAVLLCYLEHLNEEA
jgi:hypothetical protein